MNASSNTISKRIVLVSHNLNLEGAPTMLTRIATILKDAGYDIFFISMEGGYYEDKLKSLEIPYEIISNDFNVASRELDKYFLNCDLVICNTVVTSKIISRYNNIIPIVWYIRENIVIEEYTHFISDLKYNLQTKDNIYTVSELCKECIEKNFNSKDIKVVHNFHEANNSNIVNEDKNDSKINILYIGTIDNRKGLDILLEANRRLKNRDNIIINYAGSILDESYYNDIILKYNEPNINYLGVIKGETKDKIISKTDIIAVPSRDEPASLVVIEALSCKIPVIISEMVGLKYAINNENGFVFELDNIDSLTNILQKINDREVDLKAYKEPAYKAYIDFVNLDEYKSNIIKIVEDNRNQSNVAYFTRCINCGLCINKCENNAISFSNDNTGYYVPIIDENKCNNCSMCASVCPVVLQENKICEGNSVNTFEYYINLKETISNKKNIIAPIWDNGKVVYKYIDDSNFERIQYISLFEEDTTDLISLVRDELNRHKKITFLGTPCKIYAIKKAINSNNIEYISTPCFGINNSKLLFDYLSNDNIEIKNVQFVLEKIITYDFLKTFHIAKKIICEYENEIVEYDETTSIVKAINSDLLKKRQCFECGFIDGLEKKDEEYSYSRYSLQDKISLSNDSKTLIKQYMNNKFDILILTGLKDITHADAIELYALNKGLEKYNIMSAFIDYSKSGVLPDYNDLVAFLFGNAKFTSKFFRLVDLKSLNNNCNNFALFNSNLDNIFDFQEEIFDFRFVYNDNNIFLINISYDDIANFDNNLKYDIKNSNYISCYSNNDYNTLNDKYDVDVSLYDKFLFLIDINDIKTVMQKDRFIIRDYDVMFFDNESLLNNQSQKLNEGVLINISSDCNFIMQRWLNIAFYSNRIITDNIKVAMLGIILNKQVSFVSNDKDNINKINKLSDEFNLNIFVIDKLDYSQIIKSNIKTVLNTNSLDLIKEYSDRLIGRIRRAMNEDNQKDKNSVIRNLECEKLNIQEELEETINKLNILENAYNNLNIEYNKLYNSKAVKISNKIKKVMKGNKND